MPDNKNPYHHGDLRTALLEAALSIITESGPQALTIREVARRAGVSHAAPYRHFADKDELILAVVEQGFALMQATMTTAKSQAEQEPLAQFAASGMAYIDFALEYPAYYRVMYSGDLLSSTGQQSLQHTSADTFKDLISDVQTCQQLNIIRPGDPAKQALALISMVHGFVTLANDNRIAALLGENYPLAEIRNTIMSAIFEGIGTQ
ncbi:TetR/AcrR family transcriptional regulator [Oceanicoccus sp. KOV_DT_Chl]|uniref:TetR/AcrR family transcriptional regulator n=1 Tax=Oceanicoccus sp. KOV_DT_Chl TaxID=1904639 RepID=UPI000C795F30|nr:TetR/AcrR family transcriptional regulator [Oceanicoccus sp. KOV_DT_Chl]